MRIGSLFTGVAGLDMAVQDVFGGTHAWFSEIDKAASKVLAYRFPGVPNLGDITQIDWATVEPVDVLCGGFPCQDVSAAGKRAGIKDGTRSGLWAVFAEAIDALRPQYVVIENVRGLLSAAAHRTVEDDAGDYLEPDPAGVGDGAGRPVLRAAGAVLGGLADLGYDAQWATVAAADVGAPHRRERVFIVGVAAHAGHDAGRPEQWVEHAEQTCGAGESGHRASGREWRVNAHSPRNGRDEGRPESAGIVGGFDAAVSGDEPGVALLPTPGTMDDREKRTTHAGGNLTLQGAVVGVNPVDVERHSRAGRTVSGDEPGVALLPRPTTQDGANNGGPSQFQRNTLPLNAEVTLLPTPRSSDCFGAGQHGDGGMDLRTTVALFRTPNASDAQGQNGRPSRASHQPSVGDQVVLLCSASALDGAGGKTSRSGDRIDEPLLGGQAREIATAWGKYEPAIRRWESIVGPAPAPTEPNKNGNPRLSAAFSEWLMGWPAGWVTDPAIGISRNDQLRCVGNGVLSLQAVAALRYLLAVTAGLPTATKPAAEPGRRADVTPLLPTPTSRDHKGANQRGDETCLHGAISKGYDQ